MFKLLFKSKFLGFVEAPVGVSCPSSEPLVKDITSEKFDYILSLHYDYIVQTKWP